METHQEEKKKYNQTLCESVTILIKKSHQHESPIKNGKFQVSVCVHAFIYISLPRSSFHKLLRAA